MRVSSQTKAKTRTRILETARKLFIDKGFDATTTREIASVAKIATGTLFNYFSSKEALGMTLLAEVLEAGHDDYAARRRDVESLQEDLFLLIICSLRRLEEFRKFVAPVVEAALSPFTQSPLCKEADAFRVRHLERMAASLADHGRAVESSFVAIHLYWTLYLGVLGFWSRDESPNQEDTLVLLDQSMRLFVASLGDHHAKVEVGRDT